MERSCKEKNTMTSTQTGWNAHTCAHCAILVVDLSHLDSLGAFSEVQTTRIHLDYDIHLAQRAADEERPLFKWLLKVFRIVNGDSTLMTEVSFPLLIQSDGQFQDCWVIDGLDATGQPISRHQQSYISLDHHSLHMTCDEGQLSGSTRIRSQE